MKNEPVMTLIVALIAAGAGLLAAFGVNVTDEQIAALSAFAVAALGFGAYVRSRVTPTANLAGRSSWGRGERGYADPVTLLVQVVVAVIVVVLLVWLVRELL